MKKSFKKFAKTTKTVYICTQFQNMSTIPKGCKQHYKFFGWMYNQIYQELRKSST